MNWLIKGGTLVNPGNGKLSGRLDVLVSGQKIIKIAPEIKAAGASVIDAAGQYVFPGLIDLHTHLREPGYEYKEDIASGTAAAAAGGFTTVNCMPNTRPAIDNRSVVEYVQNQAISASARVAITACVTKDRAGKELTEMGELFACGVRTLSDDGDPVADAQLMRHALEYAKMFPLTIISHAEEKSLCADGDMHEGFVSTQLGLKGIPRAAEEVMVARDILLAEATGGKLHLAHLSTAGAVDLLRLARRKGLNVTGEVTPHHFTLTDEEVRSYATSTKVNPPLREKKDVKACVKGLADGTLSVIATDHAPHALFEKEREYANAPFGISGLETALSLAYTELHLKHKISLETIIAALTVNPAKILGLDLGVLQLDAAADITIFNPEPQWVVEPARFVSKGKSTPFKGRKLTGVVTHTFCNGKLVYSAAELK